MAAQVSLRLKYEKEVAYHLDSRVKEYLQSRQLKDLIQVPLLFKITESGSTSYYNLNELLTFPDRFKLIVSPFQIRSSADHFNSIHSLSGERLSSEHQYYLDQLFKQWIVKEAERNIKTDSLLNEFIEQIELSKQSKRRSKSTSVSEKEQVCVTSTELMLHFHARIDQILQKPEYLGLLLIGDRLSKIEIYVATMTSVARIFSTKEGG